VHKIDVPTLILAGELDKVFAVLAQKLHQQINGSLLNVYKQAGHLLNLEAPDRFNRDLEGFLREAGQS
jgi:pimeloyl-ACP methyl ester carboxylesterase